MRAYFGLDRRITGVPSAGVIDTDLYPTWTTSGAIFLVIYRPWLRSSFTYRFEPLLLPPGDTRVSQRFAVSQRCPLSSRTVDPSLQFSVQKIISLLP